MALTYQQIGQNPTLTDIQNPASIELADINRRKLMADMLLQQGSQMPQGQMVGGHFVAPSWTQQLSSALTPIVGAYMMNKADVAQEKLAEKLRNQTAEELVRFNELRYGKKGTADVVPGL